MASDRQSLRNTLLTITTQFMSKVIAESRLFFTPQASGNAATTPLDESKAIKVQAVHDGRPYIVKRTVGTDWCPITDIFSLDAKDMYHTKAGEPFETTIDFMNSTNVRGQYRGDTLKCRVRLSERRDDEDEAFRRDGLSAVSGHFRLDKVVDMTIECTEGEYAGKTCRLVVCPHTHRTFQYRSDDGKCPVILETKGPEQDSPFRISLFEKTSAARSWYELTLPPDSWRTGSVVRNP